tara:strand:- start:21140 stop:21358 length:219 start_codon:yes stop_codon:yes gene_type:complete
MAVSSEAFESLIRRVEIIEAALNNVISSISNLATLEQLRQLNSIRQLDIEDLQTRMTGVENNIDTLQQYHKT